MSRPGLRELKKQKTRWAIQEHAMRLFAQQGYDATTVEQIAAAAEISPSTFFRYFPTKEDVVIEDEYDPMMVELFRAEPGDRTPLAALRHTVQAAFARIDEAARAQILARAKLILSVPALRARNADNLNRTVRMVAELVAGRIGRPADDFEVGVFAGATIGAMMAAVHSWVAGDGVDDVAELVDRALARLESGLTLD